MKLLNAVISRLSPVFALLLFSGVLTTCSQNPVYAGPAPATTNTYTVTAAAPTKPAPLTTEEKFDLLKAGKHSAEVQAEYAQRIAQFQAQIQTVQAEMTKAVEAYNAKLKAKLAPGWKFDDDFNYVPDGPVSGGGGGSGGGGSNAPNAPASIPPVQK